MAAEGHPGDDPGGDHEEAGGHHQRDVMTIRGLSAVSAGPQLASPGDSRAALRAGKAAEEEEADRPHGRFARPPIEGRAGSGPVSSGSRYRYRTTSSDGQKYRS